MALSTFKDLTEIIARFNELARKLAQDHLTPMTGKELAPFAAAISKLAEQVKALEERPAASS
jgi:hypothetical protein